MGTVPVLAFIALLAGTLAMATSAEAQSPPHVFVGQALLDGVQVPDGTIIRGVLDGRPLPRAETTVTNGSFTLIVEQPQGEAAAQPVISFAVGDSLAQQSRTWQLGELTLLTLTASSALPPVPVEVTPPLPEPLVRGEEFLLTLRANTGFYQASGGQVSVDFDPEVFAARPEDLSPLQGTVEGVANPPGRFEFELAYGSPTSTIAWDGKLVQVPMRVLDSAPTGKATLSIEVTLMGRNGQTFPLEPSRFPTEVSVITTAADLNGDDGVDFADLAALGSAWGTRQGDAEFRSTYDLDGDGFIWIGDLGILLQNYPTAAVY